MPDHSNVIPFHAYAQPQPLARRHSVIDRLQREVEELERLLFEERWNGDTWQLKAMEQERELAMLRAAQ